ncbi:MAG: hypothetical protein ACRDLL_00035 [Solirubrobacterales bacterium]
MLGPEAGPAIAETISEAGVAAVAFLGDRKGERVSRTLIEISDEAATRIAAGEEVRTDIADPESDDASALFEAVIEAAAQSVEDRKCAVIANVYASIAFDSSITIADALLTWSGSGLVPGASSSRSNFCWQGTEPENANALSRRVKKATSISLRR